MDFDVTEFLQSLFAPVRIVAAPAPAPEPATLAAGQLDPDAPTPALMRTVDVMAEPDHDTLPGAGWIRRQDFQGRWGWEAPGLTEWQAWWRRCDYDGLPRPPDGLSEPTPPDDSGG